MVRASPLLSLAGGPSSTLDCCGRVEPGRKTWLGHCSTLGRVRQRGPHAGSATHQEVAMKVLNRRCAGLDVHKDEVVAVCSACRSWQGEP